MNGIKKDQKGEVNGILKKLSEGPVIGDGGFMRALEKRGYVRAGPWTPECVVKYPDAGRCQWGWGIYY